MTVLDTRGQRSLVTQRQAPLRARYATDPEKCHINYVVCDTFSWEQKLAQSLESLDEVISI